MKSEWHCPRCGSSEHSVPVWETAKAFQDGDPPTFIGCTACNEMEKVRT